MKPFILIIPFFFLAIMGCSKRVELGEKMPNARKTKVNEILCNPSAFSDDTVEITGKLSGENDYTIADGEAELILAPVGFDLPDSLIGGKAVCQGMVFYHEEKGEPGLAAGYIKVRLPRQRAGYR